MLHAVHLTLLIRVFKSPIKSHCDRHYGIIPEFFGPVGPPGKPHCSVTVGLLLLLPAAAWLGLGEPSRLVGCRSPPHLTVRARPPQGCMARMGRCTTPPQVTVQGNGREVWITIKMMSVLKLLRDDVCGVEA